MIRLTGIGASEGISLGKALIYIEDKIDLESMKKSSLSAEAELVKLNDGVTKTKSQLLAIRERVREKLGEDKAAIFDAHIELLEDEDLQDGIKERVTKEGMSAAYAINEGVEETCNILSQLDDAYLRERVSDLRDIAKRWIKNTLGIKIKDLSILEPDTIVVTDDLTPSDTAQLDLEHCVAFITEFGGKTAHSAIMARSLEIPAIVGVKNIIQTVKDGEYLVLDGEKGIIYLSPTEEVIEAYKQKKVNFLKEKEELKKLKDLPATTACGERTVNVWGNIGKPEDVDAVIAAGGEGVGLYRTEFLFMNSDHMPTEEEQYEAYKIVAQKLKGKPVTIRTMDIGGDKELPYLDLPKEMNPFLGYRAIRISLTHKDMFKTQLRAILRASAYGKIKIMYPMVCSINEIRKSNEILKEYMEELDKEGKVYDTNIQVGIMVETPSTAMIAYKFAKEVDFFSIGTNDLTQYFLAVDRGNEKVSGLYSAFNPAVLEAIQRVIDAGHDRGISVSMCGEFAGNKKATEILLGMGLDSFSMSASSILGVKKKIRDTKYEDAKKYRDVILSMNTPEEVIDSLR
ncbi:phosphoenolpyruvate-protein phosphotransferase [Sneathia vaginalis]|uniref:Phosphoenolpyruvate-protein phosphotransferase n=1 Tax=Sneathia vaginalis TaxID=187101 RepID=A0A0E3ZAW5_9FUSO|nr:phosphoenolpyruvate--protein phosphotransferase [Sneathia vaginalis]AKC95156.1 phosphoenolpyruvate-protein phosphotransferase [Sneathia vaginalis]